MIQTLTTVHGTPVHTITRSSLASSKPNQACNLFPCRDNVHAPSFDAPLFLGLSPISRRNVIALGISGVILDLNMGEKNAWAAARRPPPTPPAGEKKDPNVNGVLAKVLASKKRKEAMKEAMVKQRDRGKKIEE